MPTVPGNMLQQPQGNNPAVPSQQPSQTDLLMALATMHEQGSLNPDAPVKNARPKPRRTR